MKEKLRIIEDILGVKLTVKEFGDLYDPNQKNAYTSRKNEIDSLYLNDINIDDLSKLLTHCNRLSSLHLKDCIVPNFTEFLAIKCAYFYFDNVTFKTNDIITKKSFPREIRFSNMTIDASCFKCFKESSEIGVKYLEFKNAHIENIEELNNIKNLYELVFDNITYTYKPSNTSVQSASLLIICNTRFKDVSFLPFKKTLKTIYIENCEIESISKLTEFPKLEAIKVDSDTVVNDKTIITNPSKKKIKVTVTKAKKLLHLDSILCLKDFIQTLHLEKLDGTTIDAIGNFDKIKTLSFEESVFKVDLFTTVADQIENLYLRNTIIECSDAFSNFNHIRHFEFKSFENDYCLDLKSILPLSRQLKSIEIIDFNLIKNFDVITFFTELDSLKVSTYSNSSASDIDAIFTLHKLKKLELAISENSDENEDDDENVVNNKIPKTFSFKHLKELEYLILQSLQFNFTGFEHLKKLTSLKIGESYEEETIIDINSFPKMENLKRLNITNYDYNIEGLEQFPNLEFLKLKGVPKLALAPLKKLKVLDLTNSSVKSFSEISPLPNLERLEMSSIQNEIDLKGISKFPNLQWLTFLESYKLDDISELKHLKKLERLDLYLTNISDVSVLNELPNLKEVNLFVNNSITADLDKQIKNPEIIANCSLPSILFMVWDKDEFGV